MHIDLTNIDMYNHHYLVRFLGYPASQDAFVQDKMQQWNADVQSLMTMADKLPQTACFE